MCDAEGFAAGGARFIVTVFLYAFGFGGDLFPERQGKEQYRKYTKLNKPDGTVPHGPTFPRRDCVTHDIRADDGSDAPEAVEPAHLS